MRLIFVFVLLSACCTYVKSESLQGGLDYFVNVVTDMMKMVDETGPSSFRCADFEYPVNQTKYGLNLVGSVLFHEGFSIRWTNVAALNTITTYIEKDNVTLVGTVKVYGIWNSYNMNVSLSEIKYQGSIEVYLPFIQFQFKFFRDLKDLSKPIAVSPGIFIYGAAAEVDCYALPDDEYTTAILMAMIKTGTQPSQLVEFLKAVEVWGGRFQELLQEAAKNRPFPEVV